jgi:hypothetical protein
MNTNTILLLLLVSIAVVLAGTARALYRIKRREDKELRRKTSDQVRLMARNSRLAALK